jgi:wyosine [tRNA(Phe)-imidazoG37] synthetase (radical SAM superfamily)
MKTKISKQRFVFGPVPSRRLGRSLGVDLVPYKTCSYDCVYCQLGRTTRKTARRREWVPFEKVLKELRGKLDTRPDWITLSGSGEPTLFSRIGELIDRIHKMTDIPVAVLTNGSLLWRQEVRKQLLKADLVIPSLDAGNAKTFKKINRPCKGLTFAKMLDGLVKFRREFKGRYWLEVFILKGPTSSDKEIRDIVRCVKEIAPDKVQLNTATRPTAEKDALAETKQRLKEIVSRFTCDAEVIADFPKTRARTRNSSKQTLQIRDLIRRRPCSVEDIANGLALNPGEITKYLGTLKKTGTLRVDEVGGKLFYSFREGRTKKSH